MPMRVLYDLTKTRLPVTVTGGKSVDAVRVLHLAGHVKATFTPPSKEGSGYASARAKVTEVTPNGKRMLSRFPPPRAD